MESVKEKEEIGSGDFSSIHEFKKDVIIHSSTLEVKSQLKSVTHGSFVGMDSQMIRSLKGQTEVPQLGTSQHISKIIQLLEPTKEQKSMEQEEKIKLNHFQISKPQGQAGIQADIRMIMRTRILLAPDDLQE